jgi:hypothetical protein
MAHWIERIAAIPQNRFLSQVIYAKKPPYHNPARGSVLRKSFLGCSGSMAGAGDGDHTL